MNRTLLIGLVFTGIIAVVLLFGPYLPFVDPELELTAVYRDASGKLMAPPYPPSEDFLLGTDWNGVDLFSRLVIGARETFLIIGAVVLFRVFLSVLLAIGAFYSKGIEYVMKTWNLLFAFLPTILIVLILLTMPFVMFAEKRVLAVIIVLAIIEVGRLASVYHSTMTEVKRKTYMEAAIASGGKRWGLFKRYYFPALKESLMTTGATEMSRTMFLIAQLGVIGVFITQVFMEDNDRRGLYIAIDVSNSWPTLFKNLRQDLYAAQWIPIATFFAITFTMIGFYILADGIKKQREIKLRRYT